jgi:anti-sigma regulatory factor (Ser/Thr protein kinase)
VSPAGQAIQNSYTFPGAEVQLRELRRWLAGLLPDCEARCDVVTVAVELAANAVRHSASGRPGRFFAVEVTYDGSVVGVAVADGGGPGQPKIVGRPYSDELDGFDEHGRGLRMVQELSVRTGVIGGMRGRVVWAEVPWPAEQPSPARLGRSPTDVARSMPRRR